MIFTLTDRMYNVLDAYETDDYLIGQYVGSILETLDINVLTKSIHADLWIRGNYIMCQDKSGRKYWFTIYDDEDGLNDDVKSFSCYSGTIDIVSEEYPPISATQAQPFEWYFNRIFSDTGITLGINEISGLSRKLEFTSENATNAEMLQFVLNGFDNAEAQLDVKFDGSTPTELVLNVYKRIGEEQPQAILSDEDDSLTDLTRKGSLSELGTCLDLQGAEVDEKTITLAGKYYEEKDAAGNILYYSPKNLTRIFSVKAHEDYYVKLPNKGHGEFDGYINRRYKSEAKTQDALWAEGLTRLKKIDHAVVDYDAKGDINCSIGDNVQVVSHTMRPPVMVSARTTEYKFNDDDRSRNEYKFSNYVDLESNMDDLTSIINKIKDQIVYVVDQSVEYCLADQGTTAPVTGWTNVNPGAVKGKWLWVRTKLDYSNGTSSVSEVPTYSAINGEKGDPGKDGEQGPQGEPGPPGEDGQDGLPGKDGLGIVATQIMYAGSDSGTIAPSTGWTATIPTLSAGKYLWTQTTWLYSDNTGESGYSVSRIGKDGNTGKDGVAGKDGVGLVSTAITYAKSTSGTVTPATGWTTAIPSVPAGQFLWTKSLWAYTDGTTETGYSVAKMGDTGPAGKDGTDGVAGKDGVGLKSTAIQYAQSTSGTTAPTSGWATSVPTLVKGQYLWTKTVWTYTDNSNETGYTVSYNAKDGNNGTDGIAGKDGVGISNTVIEYVGAVSGTSKPTSGWSTTIPTVPQGQYLWTRTTWTYTDGTTEQGYSTALMGPKGDTGKDGERGRQVYTSSYETKPNVTTHYFSDLSPKPSAENPPLVGDTVVTPSGNLFKISSVSVTGATGTGGGIFGVGDSISNIRGSDGIAGADGKGIKSTVVTYQASASGTVAPTGTWVANPPTVAKGQYLWTRTIWTYTDNATETGYSVAYMGTNGNDGSNGIAGKDGVGIKSTAITYAVSSSGTTAPTSGWVASPPTATAGQFMWTKTVWTYTDNTTETGYSVGKIGNTGPKGDNGATGEDGERGNQIFKSSYNIPENKDSQYFSDLSPKVSAENPPKVGDTVISSTGKIVQITKVNVTGNSGQGGGNFATGPYLSDITGPSGPPTGVISQNTVPSSPYVGMLWQCTGNIAGYINPATYRWNGSAWEIYQFTAQNILAETFTGFVFQGVEFIGSRFVNEWTDSQAGNTGRMQIADGELTSDYWLTGSGDENNTSGGHFSISRDGILTSTWKNETVNQSRGYVLTDQFLEFFYNGRSDLNGSGRLTALQLTNVPWTNLPYESGFTTAENNPCQYRVVHLLDGSRELQMRGQVQNTGGTALPTATSPYIGLLPATARPIRNELVAAADSSRKGARVAVLKNGYIQIDTPNANTTYVSLGGIRILLE